jgi:hypothetical protein
MSTSPLTPAEKGDALHHAVLALERHILNTAPHLKNKNFKIEDKKKIHADGVHHEIDIYVTVETAPGYSEAIYIFECKNLKKKVGKTEIIDFTEKIHCAKATHAYFVAKSFTKDARAPAKKSARLSLLIATENDPTNLPIPGEYHGITSVPTSVEFKYCRRGYEILATPLTCDLSTITAEVNGTPIDLRTQIGTWADQVISKDLLAFRSHIMPVGDYNREATETQSFAPRHLVIGGDDVESATMVVGYKVTVHRPPVLWSFDIETKGRTMTFAPIVLPTGETLTSRIVMKLPKAT